MADITEALNNYLQVNHNSGILLANISESLIQEDSNNLAKTLLQAQYKLVLQENGWDFLTLFTPHLKCMDSSLYTLIDQITKLCSPKEMYLALVEQFELTENINTFTLLLPLLGNVLKSLPDVSGHLIELQIFVKKYGETFKRQSLTDIALKYKLPLPYEEEEEEHTNSTISIQYYIETLLTLLQSYTKELDHSYKQTNGHVIFDDHYTEQLQLEVIAILLELLDIVQTTTTSSSTSHDLITTIMNYIMNCHYNAVRLLEWTNNEGSETQEPINLSQNGLATFTYLLLTQYRNYLPHIMESSYLLQLCLTHVQYSLTEYSVSHDVLSLNALILLEALLKDIPRRSLFPPFLEHSIVPQVIVLLTHTMYRCPFEKVRKESYSLLLNFIDCFTINGRYLIYKRLLIEVTHPGIQGLLIHQIKEEVNNAIILQQDDCCYFLGESLYNLYRHFLVASTDVDVLSEYDRLLGGLNFMRYLLLKDNVSLNKTYVWSCCQQLKNDYLKPLRVAVFNLQNYCKAKLNSPSSPQLTAVERGNSSDDIQVDVSVIGKGTIPELTQEEETQTLYYSLHKLDIILSVLARVEELLNV